MKAGLYQRTDTSRVIIFLQKFDKKKVFSGTFMFFEP